MQSIIKRFNDAQARLVIQTADLPLGTLADMVESGVIDLLPAFQRRERWSIDKQSALIESFILNVPVPPVYLSEDEYGKYSAIDGKQRLRTICDYIKGRFSLRHLEAFREIEGFSFIDLPDEIRNTLLIRPFLRVVTLLRQSDPELKYEVFTRLNRGGEPLNPQEVRNVAFRGPMNDLIYELAEHRFLKQQLKIKDKKSTAYRQMQDAEYVLRFFALRCARDSYRGSLSRSMDEFMMENAHIGGGQRERYRQVFERAITRCEKLWGDKAFRRPENRGWRDQTLAGMYDAEMLAVEQLTEAQMAKIEKKSGEVLDITRRLFSDRLFDEAVRQGTNTPSRLQYRVDQMLKALLSLSQ